MVLSPRGNVPSSQCSNGIGIGDSVNGDEVDEHGFDNVDVESDDDPAGNDGVDGVDGVAGVAGVDSSDAYGLKICGNVDISDSGNSDGFDFVTVDTA